MREDPTLVVGAGPTGLTMACELARRGAPVRIVDKLPGILPYARATGIHSRTLEVFQDLGVVDRFLTLGQPIVGTTQYADRKPFDHTRFESVDSPYPYTIGLEQWHTEEILESLLGEWGVRVERGAELVAMEDRLDGVGFTLRHGDGHEERGATPWLVACDGAHSRVRHLNQQRFAGELDPHRYLVADVFVDAPFARDETHNFMSERGNLAFFPLPNGRSLLVADLPGDPDGGSESPDVTEVQALVDQRGPAGARVYDPRWLAYFRIHYRLGRHYRHGRTLLAGDAVHIHSPLGGQGMNTGIQDAYNLAWKLALVVRGRAPESLLESYERERRAVAEDVIRSTKAMTDRWEIFPQLSEAERERLYFHAAVPEPERLRQAQHREELDLDYRRSPICSQHLGRHDAGASFAGGPHAGARAPDAAPVWLGDRRLTLFELLRGPKHVLLLFAGSECSPRPQQGELAAAVAQRFGALIDVYQVLSETGPDAEATHRDGRLRDPEGVLHRRYGAQRECLYLIRPDGYVGYRSEPASLAALRDYLGKVLTSPPP